MSQQRFPAVTSFMTLLVGAAFTVAVLTWLSPRLFDADQAATATAFVGTAAGAAVLLSMVPVIVLASAGVMATVYGYFAGSVIRLLAFLGVLLVAIVPLDMPTAPALLGLGVYLPLMFLETALVGRYLWKLDLSRGAETQPATETTDS